MSELLAEELLNWPEVSARPMFGFRSFYRNGAIFAALPVKRALENPRAIAYKLTGGASQKSRKTPGRKWHLIELDGQRGVTEALACLRMAYERAEAETPRRS